MDLVVFIVRAERIHREIDGEANGPLSLRLTPRENGLIVNASGPPRERSTEIVGKKDNPDRRPRDNR